MVRAKRSPLKLETRKTPREEIVPKSPENSQKTIACAAGVKDSHHYRTRDIPIRVIRHSQHPVEQLPHRLSLQQLIHEVAENVKADLSIEPAAIELLQDAAEDYLVEFFEIANMCEDYARCVTLMPDDIELARRSPGGKK